MRPIRPQTVTLAVLAILFGLGAAWAVRQVLLARHVAPVVQAPPPVHTVPVLILQTNLPKDARVRTQDVGQVQMTDAMIKAKGGIPLDKAFRFPQQAKGRVLKRAKEATSYLTEDDFYEVGKEPQIKLKEGYRAMYLRIDDPAVSNTGIIQTGCLVDVILTVDNPDDNTKLSRRLCSGVEVVSPPVTEGGEPNTVTSVNKKSYIVLAVTPGQASRLELATQLDGKISVTRVAAPPAESGAPDSGSSQPSPTSAADYAVNERELLNLPPRPAPPEPPERIVVEQIKGNKIEYVVFTDDNVRLSQERVWQSSLPAKFAGAAAPKQHKKCKTCGASKNGSRHAKPSGGSSAPPPVPTPAPGVLQNLSPEYRSGSAPQSTMLDRPAGAPGNGVNCAEQIAQEIR